MESCEPSPFANCSVCKLTLSNKETLRFECCKKISCSKCVDKLMIKSQANLFTINEQFEGCPFCQSGQTIDEELE